MGIRNYIADKLGELTGNTFRLKDSNVDLPAEYVRREIDRLNNPLVVPADMLPESTRRGEGDGRALHMRVAERRRVPLHPGEGRICEDCAHFRYDAAQEELKRDSGLADQLAAKLGSRAPRLEDLGYCTVDDGQALTSRFWGSIAELQPVKRDGEWFDEPVRNERGEIQFKFSCKDYRYAGEVTSTADPRRGRALNPLG